MPFLKALVKAQTGRRTCVTERLYLAALPDGAVRATRSPSSSDPRYPLWCVAAVALMPWVPSRSGLSATAMCTPS